MVTVLSPRPDLWTLDPDVLHLNHGSYGAVPRRTQDLMTDLRAEADANPMLWFRSVPTGGGPGKDQCRRRGLESRVMIDTTRASYDTVAAEYHELLKDNLREHPYDRAALDLFAEVVPAGPIGDLGCGPGRITSYLASLGLDAFGIDLSPGMIEVARKQYPGLRFEVGTLLALDLKDDELAGALAWYSLVHTPPEELPTVFAEIYRVLRPGGYLVHAFKIGTGSYHLANAYGHDLDLEVYQYEPDDVGALLGSAGFLEVATLTRAAFGAEKAPQAYVLVRKPG